MSTLRKILLMTFALLTLGPLAAGQSRARGYKAINDRVQQENLLKYIITDEGDTLDVDEIKAARIHPKKYLNKRDWVQYYRRVHNFSKAYPYALFVAQTINETDSLFEAAGLSEKEQDRYLGNMKDDLLKNFEPIFRGLTLSQGLMMIKLIDREVGMPPYDIIRKYLGKVNANFWQGVAKMFKRNIKDGYDPDGEDADLEELVKAWHYGEFDELYMYIFGKKRPEIFIPEKFTQPYYKSMQDKDLHKGKKERKPKRKNS